MPLFRRRADPETARIRAGFDPVASRVAAAQRALLAAIPTSRDPGVPLGQALAEFAAHLTSARAELDRWTAPGMAGDREACARALQKAHAEAEALRLDPAFLDFERLNGRVGDVLHHLEVIGDLERTLRRR